MLACFDDVPEVRMEIVVQLAPEAARNFRRGVEDAFALALRTLTHRFDFRLTPVAEGAGGRLATFFAVAGAPRTHDESEAIAAELRKLPGVTSSYVKPDASIPAGPPGSAP
jgi:hypothetical protein